MASREFEDRRREERDYEREGVEPVREGRERRGERRGGAGDYGWPGWSGGYYGYEPAYGGTVPGMRYGPYKARDDTARYMRQVRDAEEWRQNRFAGRGPKGYQRPDQRILEDVSDRLTDDRDIDASEITVAVENGIVTLQGTIDDRPSKWLAEDLADSVSGVKDVRNELRVEPRFETARERRTG